MEIVGLAAIDAVRRPAVENHAGFHLEVIQSIIKKDENTTLTELYGNMIVDRKESLQALSTIVVADAWFSKSRL